MHACMDNETLKLVCGFPKPFAVICMNRFIMRRSHVVKRRHRLGLGLGLTMTYQNTSSKIYSYKSLRKTYKATHQFWCFVIHARVSSFKLGVKLFFCV